MIVLDANGSRHRNACIVRHHQSVPTQRMPAAELRMSQLRTRGDVRCGVYTTHHREQQVEQLWRLAAVAYQQSGCRRNAPSHSGGTPYSRDKDIYQVQYSSTTTTVYVFWLTRSKRFILCCRKQCSNTSVLMHAKPTALYRLSQMC